MNGLIVDLFAGGGGASAGIEAALGRPVDVAINHDAVALAVHKANHPETRHFEEDIWKADPAGVTGGRRVALLWASPDCTHFSVAKGGKPRSKGIRSLAWAVVRWAKATTPDVLFLENVTEFKGWGPLTKEGRPDKRFMGKTFHAWRRALERLGYVLGYRTLDASLYGAPTRRRRLFIIARRDGQPIVWPEETHGKGRLPLRTAAECIDWALPCPSIFERKKALAEKTQWRIAQGIRRFVLENPEPFIVQVNHGKMQPRVEPISEPLTTITAQRRGSHALVAAHVTKFQQNSIGQDARAPLDTVLAGAPRFGVAAATLVQSGYGEREGQAARVPHLDKPLGTVVAGGQKHGLVAAFLAKHYGDRGQRPGSGLDEPVATITSSDHHALAAATLVKLRGECHGAALEAPVPVISAQGTHLAEVRAFLVTYYGQGIGQDTNTPMRTVTTKDRLGLVTVRGIDYQIIDIGMRMLEPHELLRAQFGRFAATYSLAAARTKTAMVRLIGNSVCPEVAEAIVRANVGEATRMAA